MTKFYIGDWHYNHENAIKFDARPFCDVSDMNKQLVTNWNKVVTNNDIVYIVGDMFWKVSQENVKNVIDSLHGEKILIAGNHDNTSYYKYFKKVSEYMDIKDNNHHIILCHYPIVFYRNHYYKDDSQRTYHFYAHVHNTWEYEATKRSIAMLEKEYNTGCYAYNVGAMMPWINYTPRTMEEIITKGQRY